MCARKYHSEAAPFGYRGKAFCIQRVRRDKKLILGCFANARGEPEPTCTNMGFRRAVCDEALVFLIRPEVGIFQSKVLKWNLPRLARADRSLTQSKNVLMHDIRIKAAWGAKKVPQKITAVLQRPQCQRSMRVDRRTLGDLSVSFRAWSGDRRDQDEA